MLNFCSLYSGSSGNCLFVETEKTKVLIDAGVSLKKIEQGLESINVSGADLDAVIVTHEHVDHIQSVGNISKNLIFQFLQHLKHLMQCQSKVRRYLIKTKKM